MNGNTIEVTAEDKSRGIIHNNVVAHEQGKDQVL